MEKYLKEKCVSEYDRHPALLYLAKSFLIRVIVETSIDPDGYFRRVTQGDDVWVKKPALHKTEEE